MNIRKMKQNDKMTVIKMMRGFYDSPAVIHQVPDEVLIQDVDDCVGDCPYIEGFVFEVDDKIVGYGMVAKSYSTEFGGLCIWVEDIYIEPDFQGKGIGTLFFSYIENAYKNVAVRYRLEVAKDNLKAIRVYEKNGYSELNYTEMTKEV